MTSLYLLFSTSTVILAFLLLHYFLSKPKSKQLPNPLPPGPAGYPIIGNLLQMGPKPHRTFYALSLKYGPLLHLRAGAVHFVVVSSPALASLLLKTYDANFSDRPYTSGAKYMSFGRRTISMSPYGPRWRLLRKITTMHVLSAKPIDASRRTREEAIKSLITRLAARQGSAVEIGPCIDECITEIMAHSIVGKRFFSGPNAWRVGELKEVSMELITAMGEFVVGDFIPSLKWFDLGGTVAKMKRTFTRLDRFLDGIMQEHRTDLTVGLEDKDEDLLSVLFRLKECDGELIDDDIKGVLADMFIAGTDTAASTVEWALSEMIRSPDMLQQAQQELDLVVGRDRLVSESDIPNMPFLQALVKETFRLHPATPLLLPRTAAEGVEFGGYHIPKNATLVVNAWAIGRDEKSWADPLEFKPARFLPGGESELADMKGNNFEFIPFGGGRRICVGMNLGVRMVLIMTAMLVHAYDWALPTGQSPDKLSMEEAFGLSLHRDVPLNVCPKPRLHPRVYE
ncbi:flavonoid 3'-monooxygenase-like [Iris pallida]|uniref:Flavonoid 3'-monooxygenase-like n=1 Tax=Iris pallida TaxID=29817 RepID=A0AAX6IKX5_IRIPA|nr:flavonoid 3'-monooxygenase-like [Iris pallida]